MSDTNVVVVSGRLTAKPELKYLKSGTAVTDVSIGNNVYRKGCGEKNQKVNFFNVTVFGKMAENLEKYLDKGDAINIAGKLDQQKWIDKNNQNRYAVKIIANDIQFIGGKKNNDKIHDVPENVETPKEEPTIVDDIPNDALNLNNGFESPLDDDDDVPF